MIQGLYFYINKYLHCQVLSAGLAYFARFVFLCKFWLKRLRCKPDIVQLPHNEAIDRISKEHPDPSGEYEIIQPPLDEAVDLSIIIPIYNYANLITENINSVLTQKTRFRFEVILVDDGSTDGAADIVRKYSSNPQVKTIFQQNQGIASARNTGLNHAVGKYIMFVDCDDVVGDNLVEVLLSKAYSDKLDIVMCAHDLVKQRNGEVYAILPNIYPSLNLLGYTGRAIILNYAGLPWCKVYKRELFDSVRFYPNYWYEDTIVHALLFTQCEHFAYIPVVAYRYRWYENNFSHTQGNSTNPKSIDIYWLMKRILEDYESLPDAQHDERFYTMLIKHLSAYYYSKISDLNDDIIDSLFSLACDLFEQYGRRKYKVPYMLRVTEKALRNRDIALWKLASVNQ